MFAFEPDSFSPGEAVDAGKVCDVVDEAGFDSYSFLTTATGSNLARLLDDIFNRTTRDFGVFFGRALPFVDGEALVAPAMVMSTLRVAVSWDKIA